MYWFLVIIMLCLLLGKPFTERFQLLSYRMAGHYGPMNSNYGYRKRGMSRDIRGDPYIPYYPAGPWNQPSVLPIRNRRMIIG